MSIDSPAEDPADDSSPARHWSEADARLLAQAKATMLGLSGQPGGQNPGEPVGRPQAQDAAAERSVSAKTRGTEPNEAGDVRLIARAAAILRALTEQPSGASLGDLAKATGIPRSTVQRLVNALEKERLVTTAGSQTGVRLGDEIARMAAFVERDAREILRPYAADLLARFHETVDITFLDHDRAVVIENLPSPQALRAVSYIGARLPLHCTGHGKAHLSRLDPVWRHEILAQPLERPTVHTKTDPDEILAEIEASAARGYFTDNGELIEGLSAVAVTLENHNLTGYAIGIVAPTQRFDANLNSYVEKLFEVRSSLAAVARRFPSGRH